MQDATQAFQLLVDGALLVLVLCAFPPLSLADDGQQIAVGELLVAVYDALHAWFPSYLQVLSCLSALVGQHPVFHIRLFQVGHVDERHAAGVETEEKQVACQPQGKCRAHTGVDDTQVDERDGAL